VGNNTQNSGLGGQMDENQKYRSDEWGASSTANMRGGVIRIHPDDNASKGYTIPEGNFGEYFAEQYPNRADEFLDETRMLPEIWAKGTRNAYTLTLDPVRRWGMWGDCGPDEGGWITEEQTVMTHPAFYGWPYFAGDNISYTGNKDPDAPTNTSNWNEGLEVLPPAEPATYNYPRRCAMTGPIYRYDPGLNSDIKFPPHFHRHWFLSDFNGPSWIRIAEVNDDGELAENPRDIFTNINFYNIMELEMGPDGAMYINNYAGWFNSNQNTSIARLEYTGPDCDVGSNFLVEKAGCMDENYQEFDPDATHPNPEACQTASSIDRNGLHLTLKGVKISSSGVFIDLPGAHSIEILDVNGKRKGSLSGNGKMKYSISEIRNAGPLSGIHFIKVKTPDAATAQKVVF
jgi:hypothetical protein